MAYKRHDQHDADDQEKVDVRRRPRQNRSLVDSEIPQHKATDPEHHSKAVELDPETVDLGSAGPLDHRQGESADSAQGYAHGRHSPEGP